MSLPKLSLGLLIASSIFWNGWLIGWLNHGLAGYLRMSISELNVIGQPHYFLFTTLEYISGLLLIAAATVLLISFPKEILLILVSLVIAFIGLLTVYDAANPLDCNQYQNHDCLIRNNTDEVSITDKHHNTESRITAWVTIFLSILVSVVLYINKRRKTLFVFSLLILVCILATLGILNYSSHIFANAIMERIWNVAVSGDFIIVGYLATKSSLPEPISK